MNFVEEMMLNYNIMNWLEEIIMKTIIEDWAFDEEEFL